jgi:hypothetical protein
MLEAPVSRSQRAAQSLIDGAVGTFGAAAIGSGTSRQNVFQAWKTRCRARASVLRAWTADIVARMPPPSASP